MDHGDLSKVKCAHGKCLNHAPEWENINRVHAVTVPRGFFGTKTYWFHRCCGAAMAKAWKIQKRQCKKCGRTEEFVVHYCLALCRCCGRTKDTTPYDPCSVLDC